MFIPPGAAPLVAPRNLVPAAKHFFARWHCVAGAARPGGAAPRRVRFVRSGTALSYAKFVVDTATSLGQGGDKGFFKSQAQTHIAHALELLYETRRPVTIAGAFELLSDRENIQDAVQALAELLPMPRRIAVAEHFTNRLLTQPEEQLGGVRETIGNYLQYFLTPEVAEVFCTTDSTFDIGDVDTGKIICVTMPQKFQTERRYINTYLKLLFYNHTLRRFDNGNAGSAEKQNPPPFSQSSGNNFGRFSRRDEISRPSDIVVALYCHNEKLELRHSIFLHHQFTMYEAETSCLL